MTLHLFVNEKRADLDCAIDVQYGASVRQGDRVIQTFSFYDNKTVQPFSYFNKGAVSYYPARFENFSFQSKLYSGVDQFTISLKIIKPFVPSLHSDKL